MSLSFSLEIYGSFSTSWVFEWSYLSLIQYEDLIEMPSQSQQLEDVGEGWMYGKAQKERRKEGGRKEGGL